MNAPTPDPAAPRPERGPAHEARDALRSLGRKVHFLLAFAVGPAACGLFALHVWLAPCWQFVALLAAAAALWAALVASWAVVLRGAVETAAWLVFVAVWAFTGLVLALRGGSLPTAALAYVAIVVLVWIVTPSRLWTAGGMVLGAFVGLRVLVHLGALPVAEPPPIASVAYDVGLAVAIVPVLAYGLKLGADLNQVPLRHVERSAEAQRRVLGVVARAQPEIRAMAERASRGVTELAASAGQQAATAERVAAATGELEQLLARTASAADEARRTAEASRHGSAETATRLADVETQLDAFVAELAAMVDGIEALSQRTAGTEQVIDAVEDVHQAVKVLAINAGLEAARAGEAGRGIAAVAAEMRRLIGSTESGVKEGRRLLAAVRADAAATIARAEETATRLAAHVSELREARALVAGVLDGFVAAARSLDTIAAGEAEQRRQVEAVAHAMRELNDSARSLDVLAGDLSASVTQVAASHSELAGLVQGGSPRLTPIRPRVA